MCLRYLFGNSAVGDRTSHLDAPSYPCRLFSCVAREELRDCLLEANKAEGQKRHAN